MRQVVGYLKEKRTALGAAALFAAVFFASFLLYHLPMKAVLYPTGICLLLGVIFLVLDYGRAKKARQAREQREREREEQREVWAQAKRRYEDMVETFSIWAHQIKTPIASMRLNLQNEDTDLSRQLSADLFRIEQYVEMAMMVLRLDSASTDYVFREVSLDAIVREAVKKYRTEFILRRLRLDYEPLSVQVVTDEKWLSFVVEQVLSNALKYTKSGSISFYMEEPKTLCIRDTGTCISTEDLPRIFEKGYTGCNGRGDKRASGIGLYLCRQICTNLGHRITARSAPEEGTTICIDLAQ